jgi:hypothetical protein
MTIVEILVENTWIKHSWHKDPEYAQINAEVVSKSRNCPARILFKGKIIKEILV